MVVCLGAVRVDDFDMIIRSDYGGRPIIDAIVIVGIHILPVPVEIIMQ
jgi:hypothetical protein